MNTLTHDDTSLIAASRAGEIDAFQSLVERYQNLICSIAYSKTGDRLLSEDIGQDTFLAAWRGLGKLEDVDKFRPWLCGIARNLSGKALRARRHEAVAEPGMLANVSDAADGPLETLISKETEDVVWQALEGLPETYREPLVLFYREEHSVRDVARGLGLSEEATKQRLSRGRKALKENVAELVEKTLSKGRVSKTFATGIVALLVGEGAVPAAAESAPSEEAVAEALETTAAAAAAGDGVSLLSWIGAGLAVAGAIATWVIVNNASEPTRKTDPLAKTLAVLKERRAARIASVFDGDCVLRGSVHTEVGEPIDGAKISIDSPGGGLRHLESDVDGGWSTPALSGRAFVVSVSSPTAVATAKQVFCTSAEQQVALAVASHARAGGDRIFGLVRDRAGQPVTSAAIRLVPLVAGTEPITTFTGPDGRYDLLVSRDEFLILVSHPSYVGDSANVRTRETPLALDFALMRGASVSGVVRDASGTPVAGASVRPDISLDDMFSLRQTMSVTAQIINVRTDDVGRFTMTGLPPGEISLVAHSEQGSSEAVSVALMLGENAAGAELVTRTAGTIAGFVVDGSKRPLANVGVFAVQANKLLSARLAVSDDDGFFEISGLANADYWLGTATDTSTAEPHLAVRVGDGRVDDVIVVADGATLRGRVSPAALGTVTLRSASSIGVRTKSNADGVFEFALVPPGEYTVVARTLEGQGEQDIEVGEELIDVEVTTKPLRNLVGVVTDASGNIVRNVLVSVAMKRTVVSLQTFAARTDSEGRYQIAGLGEGEFEVRVFGAQFQRAFAGDAGDTFDPRPVEIAETPGSSISLDLVVAAEKPRIRGRVVDSFGAGVAGAWIEASHADAAHTPSAAPILTTADGSFEIEGEGLVQEPKLTLSAWGPRGLTRSARVDATAATTLVLREVVSFGGSVSRNGQPVTSFEVDLWEGDTRMLSVMIQTSGNTFSVPSLLAGTYRMEVVSQGAHWSGDITIDEPRKVAIDVQPAATMRGQLVDRNGAPLAGARVMVSQPAALRATSIRRLRRPITVNEDGSFVVPDLSPGTGDLIFLRTDEYELLGGREFEVEAGQTLDLGVLTQGDNKSADAPFSDFSEDLAVRFFVGDAPPTPSQLEAIGIGERPASLEKDGTSLWIARVDAGGAGHLAGFEVGDRVVSVGAMRVGDTLEPSQALASLSKPWRSRGREVNWVLERDGRQLTVPLLLPKL